MRAPIIAALLHLAATPAAAQGKLWERSKQLTCTIEVLHSCNEKGCETKQVAVAFKIDLAASQLCLIADGECVEAEAIGTVKIIDRVLVVYSGQDKPDPSTVRIWDDGRFTAMGLREVSGNDAGEGGFTMLGKCTAP